MHPLNGRTISVYRPGRSFPSLSITGTRCELMCEHCRGRFLEGMAPVDGPEALMSFAHDLTARGGTGFLLSGGCDAQGRVPMPPYLDAVKEIKRTTDLLINLHPGLVSETEARMLSNSEADRLSFDLVLDPRPIAERMHLPRSSDNHLDSFHALCRAAPGRVSPHILLGVGGEEHELESVRAACGQDIPCLVLLSLIGRKVDDWEGRLLRAVEEGRSHKRQVLLGCMRPRGRPDVEVAALERGAAGLANPSKETIGAIRERGWVLQERAVCCSLHR